MSGRSRIVGVLSVLIVCGLTLGGGLTAQQVTAPSSTPEGYVPRGTRPGKGLAPGLRVTDLGKSARTYRVNMTKGDEMLAGLTEFAEKHHIRNGHFTALGAINKGLFGWTDVERGIGQKKIELNEEAEIVSLMGSISVNAQGQSNVHAHGTVALSDGTAKGGHWWEAHVSIIAEVFVTEEEGASAVLLPATQFPEAEISNGTVTAKLYLPDAQNGYYRGTRFDWSGQIASLRVGGREYFGQWFDKYDPKIHDAIMGPVEEFLTGDTSLGYQEAPVGGTFVRIGVGVLRKPEDRAYERFRTYDIVDPGRWTVRPAKDRIEFVHELKSDLGYAYRYTKTIRLVGGKPEMLIEHVLRNTGRKAIATHQYNHNFFVMGEPTGPDTSVTFPFALKPKPPLSSNFAEVRDGKLVYTAELPKGPSVFSEFEGFGPTAADYDFRVENRKAGAGVRIQGDRPIHKMIFWSIRSTVCPEAYISLEIPPGEQEKWTYRYTFYKVPPTP